MAHYQFTMMPSLDLLLARSQFTVFPRDIPSLKYVSPIDIKLKINYKL